MSRTPLGVLDLVPVQSGSTVNRAIADTLQLVRRVEAAGYGRYWFAEHHFNPGVIGSSPSVLIALAGAVTERIRLGSGAIQLGPQHPEAIVAEDFALLDAAFPGRIDLGLGRSGLSGGGPPPPAEVPAYVTADGLLVPAQFSFARLLDAPKFRTLATLLGRGHGEKKVFADQVETILALFGDGVGEDDARVDLTDASEAPTRPEVRLFGSGNYTAELAGRLGLPFAANYHSAPSGVLLSVTEYRRAFEPSATLSEPHVIVSADVVAASTEKDARELASGYPAWVRSIRRGEGAIRYPSPEEVAQTSWTEDDQLLVEDRVRTQFVGTPTQVVERLEVLRNATQADELVLTTITHDPEARAVSYELIAEEWNRG
jgi:alkanesulfonate monooxygenase SsuD/methylene tetrahydromethanopterin reductase-like flavin-dependent oxidoreductase (luciferase family)